VPPAASLALVLAAIAYLRGWISMRSARVPFVPAWRAICFLLGLLTLWVALASPLDTFSGFLITAHMLQHMLLMMVAPPLLLLGAPLIPLVRGLPLFAAREFAGPFLNWRAPVRVGHALTNLWVALVVMGSALFAWHTPRLYELALASSSWHEFEHACFFVASLIFWWPVVQPWPSRARAQRWMLMPYLLIGDLQNTVLSAILVFSDRVLYPSYEKMPRLSGISALHDQAASGAVMWVVGSLAFVVPAVVIAVQCLSSGSAWRRELPLPSARSSSFAALRSLAAFLAWPRQRLGACRVEALSFVVWFAVAGISLAALAGRPSDDDDQALRMRASSGPFAVAVFTAPGDLPAGSNSFSVVVQDSETQRVLPEAIVELTARSAGGGREAAAVRAGPDDSNKLLQSGELDLPAGDWSLLIKVRRGANTADFALPLKVVKPKGGFALPWPWRVLAIFAVVLLLAYWRRHRASPVVSAGAAARAGEGGHAGKDDRYAGVEARG